MLALTDSNRAAFIASAASAAEMLKVLANDRRLLILCQLGDGELSVGELTERVGLTQSALSQHLSLLREHGIVSTRRQSQTIFYRNCNASAVKLIHVLAEIYCPDTLDGDPR